MPGEGRGGAKPSGEQFVYMFICERGIRNLIPRNCVCNCVLQCDQSINLLCVSNGPNFFRLGVQKIATQFYFIVADIYLAKIYIYICVYIKSGKKYCPSRDDDKPSCCLYKKRERERELKPICLSVCGKSVRSINNQSINQLKQLILPINNPPYLTHAKISVN